MEHLKIVEMSGDMPVLVGRQEQPPTAVVSRRLGGCMEAGENPISILGRRIDSRFTPQSGPDLLES